MKYKDVTFLCIIGIFLFLWLWIEEIKKQTFLNIQTGLYFMEKEFWLKTRLFNHLEIVSLTR